MNNYYKPLKKVIIHLKTLQKSSSLLSSTQLPFSSFCLFVFMSFCLFVFLFSSLLCIHSLFFFYCIYFWKGKNPEKYKISCVNLLPFYKTKKQADVNQSLSPKPRAASSIKQNLEISSQSKTENETNKNFFYYS